MPNKKRVPLLEKIVEAATDENSDAVKAAALKEIKRKTISGATSFFFRTIILQLIGVSAGLALSFFFSPEDYGVYGLVTQVIGLLVFFSDIGLAATLIQRHEEPTLTDYRSAFTVQQILSWLIALVVLIIILSGVVSHKTGTAGNWILLSLALSFPLASIKTVSSIMLERKLEFSKLIFPQIIEQLFFQGILVFLAYRHFGAIAYAYAIIIRDIMGVVTMWIIKPWNIGFAIDKKAIQGLIKYGAKFQLNDLLSRVKDSLFYIFLGFFLPLKDFGYLNWANQWSMYPYTMTVQNVMEITFPTFSRLQAHKEALKVAIEKSLFYIALVIFPLIVGMCVFIRPFTEVIPSFSKWQPALPSFYLFTLSIGFAALSTPLTNTLSAIGEINITLKLMIMWTSLTWIITPLVILKFGFNGVAITSAIIAITSVLPAYFVKKFIPIKVLPQIWRQLLAAILMGLAGLAGASYWNRGYIEILTGIILLSVIYGVILASIGFSKMRSEFLSLLQ